MDNQKDKQAGIEGLTRYDLMAGSMTKKTVGEYVKFSDVAAYLASQSQAAQPSELTESETTGLAKLADRIEEADEQPMVIARSAARAIDKLLAAHLAGQSQAARPSNGTEYEADDGTVAARLNGELLWHAHIYPNAGTIDAVEMAKQVAAHLAGQSQATRAVPDLHNAIMNLPCERTMSHFVTRDTMIAYKEGHRDARHAAAELVNEAVAAQEVTQQAAPEAEVAAFEAWASSEKYNMTTHPLHWLFLNERTYAARQGWKAALRFAVTQQAAKAETAEQAEGEQANVLPPFAAPASRVHFDDATIEAAALKHVATEYHNIAHLIPNYRCTEQFARLKAFAEELASGFREGRNAQPDSSNLAPTTSTVSAPLGYVSEDAMAMLKAGRSITVAISTGKTSIATTPIYAGTVSAPEEVLVDAAEGIEILDNLVDSIERHGNYSQDTTIGFLNQALQCFAALRTTSGKGEAA